MFKKLLIICFLIVSIHSYSQLRTGILVGGGIGLEQNLSVNKNNTEFLKGVQFKDTYLYNVLLGYRFRFENQSHKNLFFDIDPLLKLQTFKSSDFEPGNTNDYTSVTKEAHYLNFQLAVSASANYKIFKELYVGLGIEPTWNIVTDGKPFDIPILGKIGYNFNNKVDISLTYRQGFTNTINDSKYSKGRTSDIYLSIFIPFTVR